MELRVGCTEDRGRDIFRQQGQLFDDDCSWRKRQREKADGMELWGLEFEYLISYHACTI